MKGAGQPRGNLPACSASTEERLCLTQKLHLTGVRVNPNPDVSPGSSTASSPPRKFPFRCKRPHTLPFEPAMQRRGCRHSQHQGIQETEGFIPFSCPNAPFQGEIRAAQAKLKDLEG